MTPALVAILLELVVFAAFVAVVVMVLRRLRRRVAADAAHPAGPRAGDEEAPPVAGGWRALAAHWATAAPPRETIATRASIMVGRTVWRNCVAVGVGPEGLHLAVRIPILGSLGCAPLLIPWSAVVSTAPTTLWWREARQLSIGRPLVATITLPGDLWATIGRGGHLAVAV